MACPGLSGDAGFVGAVLRFVDCEARTIGAAGYQALGVPGSPFWLILTGMLTLFVALFGYRMLLGHVPSVREGVLAFVKIGIVLLLATSWPAWQVLVYDIVWGGPADLASQIGGATGLPGTTGGMTARLEAADQAMVTLSILGPGQPAPSAVPSTTMAPLFGGFDTFALGSARIFYLLGILGTFAIVRIVAGILLAAGPLFIAFLLFDGTRGWFEGWLRVLVGAALGALGLSLILGVQLALIEPWLADLLASRSAGFAVPDAPVELLVVNLMFALLLIAMLWATARVARGFRLPRGWGAAAASESARGADRRADQKANESERAPPAALHSRAAAVAEAVAAGQRREAGRAEAALPAGSRVPVQAAARDSDMPPPVPLGQSHRRRSTTRISRTATRRNASA